MFIRVHEADYMFVTTSSEKGEPTLAIVRCQYSYLGIKVADRGDGLRVELLSNSPLQLCPRFCSYLNALKVFFLVLHFIYYINKNVLDYFY